MSQSTVCNNLEDLYESALLLIGNASKLRDWCNGDENTNVTLGGKSVPSLRKLIANINQVAGVATLQNIGGVRPDGVTIGIDDLGVISVIAAALRQTGGGLNVDASGKLYVDFSQMPTGKFENLLKSLRLPLWLSGNVNFYVDQNNVNASDVLDQNRGLDTNKPFKNLQPCINYIVDNYNIGSHTVTIIVRSGTFYGIKLGQYNKTTGMINIQPEDKNNGKINIQLDENHLTAINCTGGDWNITGPNIIGNYNLNNLNYYSWGNDIFICQASNNALLKVEQPEIEIQLNGTNVTISGTLDLRGFYAASGATIQLQPLSRAAKFIMDKNFTKTSGEFKAYPLFALDNGTKIYFSHLYNAPEIAKKFYISGEFTTTCKADSGAKIAWYSQNNTYKPLVASDSQVIGKRYEATAGASIDTKSQGADYFPGNVAGTADASTYSWYK